MFSRSHKPSQLQKLAFRTISLQEGELSTLLNLTPQLIELDIIIPPMYDILNLIDCEEGSYASAHASGIVYPRLCITQTP